MARALGKPKPRTDAKRRNERPFRRLSVGLSVRMTPAELEAVRATAAAEGLSLNTVVRKAVLAYAGLSTDLTPTPAEIDQIPA